MNNQPFFDPGKSFEDNYNQGPFGPFTDGHVYQEKGEPTVNFFGQKVYLSFGIPAGPLLNSRFINAAFDKGFDIAVYKTVRASQYPSHPWPNVLPVAIEGNLTLEQAKDGVQAKGDYETPLSITNSFGVPSVKPEIWQKDIRELINTIPKGKVVIGAFQGTKTEDGSVESYIADFVKAAALLKETGIKIFEVNLSCPNEGSGELLCFDINRVETVVKAIKKELKDLPLIIKIAYFESDEQLARLVKIVGPHIQGIAAINTIAAKIVNDKQEQALPGEGRLVSGVCGAGIKWAGLDMVKRLQTLRIKENLDFTIIGVGGVMNQQNYHEYKNAGADAVMSATGAMWDPFLAQKIKQSL